VIEHLSLRGKLLMIFEIDWVRLSARARLWLRMISSIVLRFPPAVNLKFVAITE